MEQRMREGEKDRKNKGEGEMVWELMSVVVIGHSRSQSTTEDSPQCLNIAFRVLCWDNFVSFVRFRTTHGQTDGAISSRVKFCFRCAYSEVCTTKIPPHPVPYRPPAHVLLGNEDMS